MDVLDGARRVEEPRLAPGLLRRKVRIGLRPKPLQFDELGLHGGGGLVSHRPLRRSGCAGGEEQQREQAAHGGPRDREAGNRIKPVFDLLGQPRLA